MPIYEYRCKTCGRLFEAVVYRADDPVRCTACNSDKVERQTTSVSIGSPPPLDAFSGGCGGGGGGKFS